MPRSHRPRPSRTTPAQSGGPHRSPPPEAPARAAAGGGAAAGPERPFAIPRRQARAETAGRTPARTEHISAGTTEAQRPASKPSTPAEKPPPGTYWLHGLHAVAAALANPRRGIKRLLLTEDAEAALAARLPEGWRRRVQPERADRARFATFLPEDSVHQGAALLVHPLDPPPIEEIIAARPGPVLLLDQVTDPRNVGAILRSGAAFGAACVIVQDRHAPPESAAMARAASGALETVPLLREVNLSRALLWLQKQGFWTMGLAGDATRTLAEALPRDRRVALVLGAEDTGLRRLQRETCDELVRLPIAPEMESLNVSAAAAVALYEIARGRA
ncbi:MAG: TrmH family RNA methyltransferase [Acetobacteraceae bacterium]